MLCQDKNYFTVVGFNIHRSVGHRTSVFHLQRTRHWVQYPEANGGWGVDLHPELWFQLQFCDHSTPTPFPYFARHAQPFFLLRAFFLNRSWLGHCSPLLALGPMSANKSGMCYFYCVSNAVHLPCCFFWLPCVSESHWSTGLINKFSLELLYVSQVTVARTVQTWQNLVRHIPATMAPPVR